MKSHFTLNHGVSAACAVLDAATLLNGTSQYIVSNAIAAAQHFYRLQQ